MKIMIFLNMLPLLAAQPQFRPLEPQPGIEIFASAEDYTKRTGKPAVRDCGRPIQKWRDTSAAALTRSRIFYERVLVVDDDGRPVLQDGAPVVEPATFQRIEVLEPNWWNPSCGPEPADTRPFPLRALQVYEKFGRAPGPMGGLVIIDTRVTEAVDPQDAILKLLKAIAVKLGVN